MRKLVLTILMATAAAAPAYAQRAHAWGSDDNGQAQRDDAREARHQARENRENAKDNSATVRSEALAARRQAMESRRDAAGPSSANQEQAGARVHAEGRAVRADVAAIREARAQASQSQGGGHRWRSSEDQQRNRALRQNRVEGSNWRQSDRAVPHVLRDRAPIVSSRPREGTQPPLRVRSRDHATQNWNTRWRHNDRYDWQSWRNRHRSLFRVGFYNDPFGWNYQSYNIGWRMWPSYYSSRYWISDPWQYRLPYAPPGYRWVRYWDDAILVDTWSGEVVDVIRNFFW